MAGNKNYQFLILSLLFVAILILSPDTAHAGYLDPGSGSTLVQGIIAAIAAIKRFWRKIIGIFTSKKG
ncbi:hypothetical protein [Desulfovibrio sp. ZJ369]|uniref:hypothetical protein n=1 Tax=Desulfovibrio sp. ZJ369 TaxID=2709793 RepID=UPI0013EBC607|nr:hypothetical protein [Desulfovibrio sp. ZJ369]